MEINYIILAHQAPEQLKRLILKLTSSEVFFYIHIDEKSEIELFRNELLEFKNVFLLENRVNVIWGNYSQIEATLIAIRKIVSDKRKGYCTLISGSDYPIKSNKYIKEYLKKNNGKNFIYVKPVEEIWKTYSKRINAYNYHLSPNKRKVVRVYPIYSTRFYSLTNVIRTLFIIYKTKQFFPVLNNILKKRVHPVNIKPYGGSQWWSLPMKSIIVIIKFIESNKSFLEYHQFTHVPDEIFFHTIVKHLFLDEEIKNSLTYVNWSRKGVVLPVTFKDEQDFQEIQKSCHLYARKFNKNTEILDKIDSKLLNTIIYKIDRNTCSY